MWCMSCPSRGAPGCVARLSLTLWCEALAPTACLTLQRATLHGEKSTVGMWHLSPVGDI